MKPPTSSRGDTTCYLDAFKPAEIDPKPILRPSPGSSTPTPEIKSLLVLFFRKEQDSSFSEEKEAKRLLLSFDLPRHPGFGRRKVSTTKSWWKTREVSKLPGLVVEVHKVESVHG